MSKRLVVLVALLAVVSVGMFAAANGYFVGVDTNARFGDILVDEDGMSIYLYMEDTVTETESASVCEGVCTGNWPPLLVEGDVTLAPELDPELFGTIQRPDGTVQATYNGWPLYRSNRDRQAGDILGQRLGDVFFLVAPDGTPASVEMRQAGVVDEDTMNRLMTRGGQLYGANCAACHGDQGQGLVGPGFAGNSALVRTEFVVPMILDGFPEHGMPAWRNVMSDEEVAAVATFLRNSWGNDFGPVTAEEVTPER